MPIIDALMREMNDCGFMPNRGRMIVASYLTHDLKIDWRIGANYFEKMLIDHDTASNYGGWIFSSGLGPGRVLVFNTLTQSRKFDPKGEYIKKWCPELEDMNEKEIHTPWLYDRPDYYPMPIVCPKYTDPNYKKPKRNKEENAEKTA